MAYNNYFPYYYPQYAPQGYSGQSGSNYGGEQGNTYTPSNGAQNGFIWVQGETGAKAYPVAPNCTVQLWDSEAQVVYLKSADASGMPSMKVLDYTIREQAGQRALANEVEQYVLPTPRPAYVVQNPNCCNPTGCGCGSF